jgi:hypothetical protein
VRSRFQSLRTISIHYFEVVFALTARHRVHRSTGRWETIQKFDQFYQAISERLDNCLYSHLTSNTTKDIIEAPSIAQCR